MTESSTSTPSAMSWKVISAAAPATTTSSRRSSLLPRTCKAAPKKSRRRGRNEMGIEGIGARTLRKEDKRFITGRGRYTDDMNVPGMHYAAFARSPHAHAKIGSIDATAAKAMPGVVAVLDGTELAADGIGNLIC